MPQTFCYLCIKKHLTLPHTPLRILMHRTKNTYEPPKERITKRTNHKKNDQKNEPKSTNHEKNDQKYEPRKARPKSTNHEKNDRKARTTKRTNQSTNHEKHDRKARAPKHESKARIQPRCLQARLSKLQSTASAPNRFLAPQNAILPLS